MAVLTANINRPYRLAHGPLQMMELPLAGYTNYAGGSTIHTVYHGSVVCCDVSDTDGYFIAADALTFASGDIFGGIALEKVDVAVADAADGSKVVTVARNGVWGFAKNSLAQTDVGAPVYVLDDGETAQASSTNALWIGYLEEVDGTYAWVNIEPAFLRANTAT